MSDLFSATYNPDVLSCLANLSNDEVFTPPEIVNQMLDMLPEDIWRDKNATFLDPACKSGVFLREIAKRLIEAQLPNYEQISYEINEKLRAGGELDGRDIAFQKMLESVIEHVFKNQVFGIAITELTSLLSRRSVYCSKYPQSEYSVVRFDNPEGNIDYKQMPHTWKNGKCVYCGAPKADFDREDHKELYAYEFIHLENLNEVFDMKFDVIIGNPPYQLENGGAQKSASPIYQLFIDKAMKLNPRYLAMVVPARWYSGGRGLDGFRDQMLNDRRIKILHDFPETSDCFPGINIRGGVCYFLWEREYAGDCKIVNHINGAENETLRPLLEEGADILIRHNAAMPILDKVRERQERPFSDIVHPSKPFGLRGFFDEFNEEPSQNASIRLYRNGKDGFVSKDQIPKNKDLSGSWKVIVSEASPGGDEYPHLVLAIPKVSEPQSICTETYLMIGPFENEEECENVISYMKTRFFRFLVLLIKNTQHTTRKVYRFVPMQDFSHPWCDEELYLKYDISEEEISFIESLVKER